MTLLEQIESQLRQLPPDKQSEVLDFVTSLQQRLANGDQAGSGRCLCRHPAFGSWQGRNIDALTYQRQLRSEWDSCPAQGTSR